MEALLLYSHPQLASTSRLYYSHTHKPKNACQKNLVVESSIRSKRKPILEAKRTRRAAAATSESSGGVPLPPLDLTEENVGKVLLDARSEARHRLFHILSHLNREPVVIVLMKFTTQFAVWSLV